KDIHRTVAEPQPVGGVPDPSGHTGLRVADVEKHHIERRQPPDAVQEIEPEAGRRRWGWSKLTVRESHGRGNRHGRRLLLPSAAGVSASGRTGTPGLQTNAVIVPDK